METTIKSQPNQVSSGSELRKFTSSFEEFLNTLEKGRFGYAPLLLIIMVCLGGIASGFAVQVSELQLIAVSASTVFIEVLIVAMVPMRSVFWASVAALLIDLLVFIL